MAEVQFAHVGLQKTGSTWLQTGLFRHHPAVKIVGSDNLRRFRQAVQELYGSQFSQEAWQNKYLDQITTLSDDGIYGLSNEQLAGHIFDTPGGIEVAHRLLSLFGDIRIILVLRHPVTFIQSAYVQSVKSGTMTASLHSLLQDAGWRQRISTRVNYSLLIDCYQSLFSNVLILPFELLREDAQGFSDRICEFLGIDHIPTLPEGERNPRISFVVQEVMRRSNHIDLLLWPKERYISRVARKILRHTPRLLPPMTRVSTEFFTQYPEFNLFARENYQIWSEDLVKYNYFHNNTLTAVNR